MRSRRRLPLVIVILWPLLQILTVGTFVRSVAAVGKNKSKIIGVATVHPLFDSISESELAQLDDFELKLLKDFVRGRGFGSVSKLPHDEIFASLQSQQDVAGGEDEVGDEQQQQQLDPNDKDVVSIGSQFSEILPTIMTTPPPLPPRATAPPRRRTSGDTKDRARTLSDLTLLLKSFIQRRREEEGPTMIDDDTDPTPWPIPRATINPQEPRRLTALSESQRPSLLQSVDPQRLASVFNRIKGGISRLKTAAPPTTTTVTTTTTTPTTMTTTTTKPSTTPIPTTMLRTTTVQPAPTNQWVAMEEESHEDVRRPPIAFSATIAPSPLPPGISNGNGLTAISAELDRLDKITQLRQQLNELLNSGSTRLESITTATSTVKTTTTTTESTPRPPSPRVFILREGSAEQVAQNQYRFIATTSLIFDNGKRILVDTGLATDINGRTEMLQSIKTTSTAKFLLEMADLNVAPPSIDIVVTTHGHPDHAGNTNEFPDARHYAGFFMHQMTVFNLSDLFEKDTQKLTENVHLVRAPGHTSDDIAVIVRNSLDFGTVAITGDVFIRKEDMDYQMMWRPLSFNEDMQNMSRRKLLCQVDFIIPGHGGGFHVSMEMRRRFACTRK